MSLTNPHDKQSRIDSMIEIRETLDQLLFSQWPLRHRLHHAATDVLAYLRDESVHYGCPSDDACEFREREQDELRMGDTVVVTRDAGKLRAGTQVTLILRSFSLGAWLCGYDGGEAWIPRADMVKLVDSAAVPSPPQDHATTT